MTFLGAVERVAGVLTTDADGTIKAVTVEDPDSVTVGEATRRQRDQGEARH